MDQPPRPSSSRDGVGGIMPQASLEDLRRRNERWGTHPPRPASPIQAGELTGGNQGQGRGQQGKGRLGQKGRARSHTPAGKRSKQQSEPAASSSGYGRAQSAERHQSADKGRGKRQRVREAEADGDAATFHLTYKAPDHQYPVIISVV